jgi:hypothetical protein
MVTAPLGSTDRSRAFLLRRQELIERLRWAGPRSRRRRQLQAELDRLVRAELEAETARSKSVQPAAAAPSQAKRFPAEAPYGGRVPYWIER